MKIKTYSCTYLGRRAEVKEIYEAGAHGRREIRIRWIDAASVENGGWPAGTIISRTVTGNFMGSTGRTLVEPHPVDEF